MSASAPIIPPRMRRGDTVGIVAPAGPVNAARFASGLARLGDTFRVKLGRSLAEPRAAGVASYLAASDEQRADELNAMLADPDVRGIILARGGYGLTRILDRLDPQLLARDPKPICGFSDATALLSWAYVAAGVRGIHGPLIVQLEDLPDAQLAHLIALLTEARAPGVRPWQLAAHGQGTHDGHLIAANLTLASMLVATPWQLPLAGAVLLLEEVGEKPYELDRYLTQLRMTGQLSQVRAVVLGELTRCVDPRPPSGEPDADDASLAVAIERLRGIPLVVGAPVGHGSLNEPVPFGAHTIVDLDARTVEITEPAVR
jgi:muramoyltetrapeptide carboxypeptidase